MQGKKKEHEVFFFFIATMLLPVISLILTATIVRSLHRSIHVRIIRTVHHKNVAGLVLTGIFVTFYIIACDVCALCYAYFGSSEISKLHQLKITMNYISTTVLFAFDAIVCFIPLTVLLYICCKHVEEQTHVDGDRQTRCNRCVRGCFLKYILQQVFKLYFNAVFGTLDLKGLWKIKDEKVEGFRLVWIITLSLIAPLFAISSHISFILVSWLTNKTQASSVALICLAVLSFSFFMFRQCYAAMSVSKRIQNFRYPCLLPLYPFVQGCRHICVCFYLCCCCCCDKRFEKYGNWIEKGDTPISMKLALRNEALALESSLNPKEKKTRADEAEAKEEKEAKEGDSLIQNGEKIKRMMKKL